MILLSAITRYIPSCVLWSEPDAPHERGVLRPLSNYLLKLKELTAPFKSLVNAIRTTMRTSITPVAAHLPPLPILRLGKPRLSEERAHRWSRLTLSLLTLCTSLTLLGGCRSAGEDVSKVLEALQQSISRNAPDTTSIQNMASDEVTKLFAIEYKIIEVTTDLKTTELEAKLNELGKERWECAPMHGVGLEEGSPRLLCRRLPVSYLKLLFHLF